jgi:peroxiredoxin
LRTVRRGDAAIVETWRRFSPRGFETLAVSMSYDPPSPSPISRNRGQLPFGVVIDNTGEIAARFGDVRFTPTTMLINKRGEIVRRWVGAGRHPALQQQIERLLRGNLKPASGAQGSSRTRRYPGRQARPAVGG